MSTAIPTPSLTVTNGVVSLSKKPTGIRGFDEITRGGLPSGRISAITGGPGAGKTVFALQVLVNWARTLGEPGLFVSFEEPVANIRQNIATFDWDAGELIDSHLILTGVSGARYDIHSLLQSLSADVGRIGARNIVFDGFDVLLSELEGEQTERQELARLGHWIKTNGLLGIITVKAPSFGPREQQRLDLVQYSTDCVIQLENTKHGTAFSRAMRILKYRGSGHASNLFPTVITRAGMEIVMGQDAQASAAVSDERVSSGIPKLDALLGGGYMRGVGILVSGAPGTAKSSLAACFVNAACTRGERAAMLSLDDSARQIVHNMRSVGLDLESHEKANLLRLNSFRSAPRSPEDHYLAIRDCLEAHAPTCLVVDTISALMKRDYPFGAMIADGLVDYTKSRGITLLLTSQLEQEDEYSTLSYLSTISDTWLRLSYAAQAGEWKRSLSIAMSRGSAHSNGVHELRISASGLDLG